MTTEARDKRVSLKRLQEIEDMQAVLATRQGRAIIWRELERSGLYSPSFVAGEPDTTAFKEGARNHGLFLLQEVLTANAHAYTIMRQEAVSRDTELAEREEETEE